MAYNAAHWPFQVPDHPSVAPDNGRFVQPEEEPTSTRADYVRILERADRGVGQILATLERLGLTRNTLVIFTNDNGGEWLSRNAPLFHRKQTVWEGGIRVPAHHEVARTDTGRPHLAPGRHRHGPDGDNRRGDRSPVPGDAKLEGINLVPLVQPGAAPTPRRCSSATR